MKFLQQYLYGLYVVYKQRKLFKQIMLEKKWDIYKQINN